MFEKKLSVEEIAKVTEIDESIVKKVQELNINSEHKRLQAQKPDRE